RVVVGDRDRVAVGRVDRNRVRLTIAAAGHPPAQVDGDLPHAGSGQIVDRDVVGVLALRLELDTLDTAEIDVAVGTGEQRPGAAGRDGDGLAFIGAVEVERIEAGSALDYVIAVERIPD